MNPLPPIEQPTSKAPPKPAEPLPALDIAAYSAGPAAVFATQLYSKSYPHLAEHVAGNVLGPKFNVAEGKHGIKPSTGVLTLFPAPVGFVDPTNFGLAPNYVYGLEARARQLGVGLEKVLPPPSTLLHNLPDYDPRVRYEQFRERAKEQRREVAQFALNASVNDIIDLIELTKGADAPRIFFDPAEIEKELIVSGANKAGGLDAFKAAQVARNVSEAQRFLPAPGTQPTRVPSVFDGDPLPSPVPTPLLPAPPTTNQQREAMKHAPPLLEGLVTERTDP